MAEQTASSGQGKGNDPTGIRRLFLGFAMATFGAVVVFVIGSLMFLIPPLAAHEQRLQLHDLSVRGLELRLSALEARTRQLKQDVAAAQPAAAPAPAADEAPAVELPLISGTADAGAPAK